LMDDERTSKCDSIKTKRSRQSAHHPLPIHSAAVKGKGTSMAAGTEVSKPVMIAGIAAAVVVVCALAYHFVIPHNPSIPASMRQKYMDHTRTTPTTYSATARNSPSSGGSPQSGGTYGAYGQNSGGQ
jgi:hypothetical protein